MDEIRADELADELEAFEEADDGARIGPALIGWLIRQGKLLRARVLLLENEAIALSIVNTVADLPASAGARHWFRVTTGTVAERRAVYVGNGAGLPLTQIPTLPFP